MSERETRHARLWRLRARPGALPGADHVTLGDEPLAPLEAGEVRVRNRLMSLEPALLGQLSARSTYAQALPIGGALIGPAVGEVVESADSRVVPGMLVLHNSGWRDLATVPAAEVRDLPAWQDPVHALSVLGLAGMTAWVGLRRIAQMSSGQTVLVSSAAGAVGSVAVQLARAAGCTVIGIAGGEEKCQAVLGLGAHAVVNHRLGDLNTQLAAALASAGAEQVDVFFDTVGGEQLEAAIRHMAVHGRIVLCGMTSVYGVEGGVPGPRNLLRLIWNRVRMEGFLLRDHEDSRDEFLREVFPLLESGQVSPYVTLVPGGLAEAWSAYRRMGQGEFRGKALLVLP